MRPVLATLNHLLAQAPWARQRLMPFAGRRAAITVATLRLDFMISGDGLLLPIQDSEGGATASRAPEAAEVLIRLPADTPLLLLRGIDKVFAAAHVEGAADFASALGFVLQHLEWDYEEDLAHLFGDIVAHRLAGTLRGLLDWQRESGRRLGANLSEYLTEEQPVLLARRDLASLAQEIAAFDARLQQCELRLSRLAHLPTDCPGLLRIS